MASRWVPIPVALLVGSDGDCKNPRCSNRQESRAPACSLGTPTSASASIAAGLPENARTISSRGNAGELSSVRCGEIRAS